MNKTCYDFAGRTTKTIADYTDGILTASSNQTTTYAYDGSNHVTLLTAVMPSRRHNQQTQYVYRLDPTVSTGHTSSDPCPKDLLQRLYAPNPSTTTHQAAPASPIPLAPRPYRHLPPTPINPQALNPPKPPPALPKNQLHF